MRFLDKDNREIKEGHIIAGKHKGQTYNIITFKNKLYADNGSHMFPLDSKEYNLKDFKIIGG